MPPSASHHPQVTATSFAGTAGRLLRRVYLFEWVALASLAGLVAFAMAGPVTTQYLRLNAYTFWRLLVITLLAIVLATGVRVVRGGRRRAGLRTLAATLTRTARGFGADAVRIVVAGSVVETAHLLLKAYIPVITAANHDPQLARLDAALLGPRGVAGVAGLFTGHPVLLHAVDLLYSGLYFFVLWGGLVAFFALLDEDERIRFFTSFCLMWQMGLLLYLLLPSWGPVFVTPAAFDGVLAHMPLTVIVQHGLFRETSALIHHQYHTAIRFFGIAAFPSLHVAVIFLYALWARRSRVALTLLLVLTGLMLLGSMVTGYHYLVDGLVGLLLAAFVTIVARRWPAGSAAPPCP